MKEKLTLPGDLKIRQDPWNDSPCRRCVNSPCCRNLPLLPHRLETQTDFINLTLSSCYNGIFPALKESGEWTVYLGRSCGFLDSSRGSCSIHNQANQSLICKSYDAHRCWYVDAFSRDGFKTLIPFNTDMMLWFEQRYELIANRFDVERNWSELCEAAYEFRQDSVDFGSENFEPIENRRLSFKMSRSEQFLFFPPYTRPVNRNHFELLSFRLGFPGVYLAIADNCWAFLVKTSLNNPRLQKLQQEYYPAIGHADGRFSFTGMSKDQRPFSRIGEQWIILSRPDLEILKGLTIFDSSGQVKRIPSSTEILAALKTQSPDRAA